jgi:hypothetical protein
LQVRRSFGADYDRMGAGSEAWKESIVSKRILYLSQQMYASIILVLIKSMLDVSMEYVVIMFLQKGSIFKASLKKLRNLFGDIQVCYK